MSNSLWRDRVAVIFSCLFLTGAAVDRLSVAPPRDPEPFHARVREAAKALPTTFGDWSAIDSTVPPALPANVYIDRRMTNSVTGEVVSLLIIQCTDARDLIPHYPAVCYPGRGLNQVDVRAKDWRVGPTTITGSEYEFDSNSFRQASALVVENFMILPTGEFCREMKEVKHKLPIRDRFFGLGQVQLVFAAGTSEEDRDKAFSEIIGGHMNLIDAMRSGSKS